MDQLALERFFAEQQMPFGLVLAGSVAQARDLLAADRFDAVVSDYEIGDGTAFDVIPLAGSVPVVVVTGSGDEVIAVRALRAGAAGYLIKDRERTYLRILPATLEHVIQRSQSAEQVTKLTRAVEMSPVSVMFTDSRGRIEYVNPRFTLVTGYEPDEVVGQNPRILKSGHHSPEFYQTLWQTVAAGRPWHGELCNRNKSGELFWESLFISPVVNHAGVVTHFVAVGEVITPSSQANR